MFSNPSSSGDTICHDPALAKDTEGRVPLPDFGVVDVYEAGFECQDRSSRNTKPKPLTLDWAVASDATAGVSSRTLMASMLRINAIGPRVLRLENVGNLRDGYRFGVGAEHIPRLRVWAVSLERRRLSFNDRARQVLADWCLAAMPARPLFRMGIGASQHEVSTARRRRLQTCADLCVCTCGGGVSKDRAAWMESVCPCHGGALGGRSRAGASSIGPICPSTARSFGMSGCGFGQLGIFLL